MDRLDKVFKLLNFDAILLTNTSEDFVAAIRVVADVNGDKELADECDAKLAQIAASPHYPGNEAAAEMTLVGIYLDGGSIEGHVSTHGNTKNLFNYLQEQVGSADMTALEILMALDGAKEPVAVVKFLSVEENSRGKGLGNQLMQDFFERSNASSMVLLCDAHQEQADGFLLERFYEGFDFERVIETPSGPLMIYPPEIAALAREKIGPSKASEPIPQVRTPRP